MTIEFRRTKLFLFVFLPGAALGWLIHAFVEWNTETPSLILLSPDERWRAELLECKPRFIDRNFRIRLTNPTNESSVTVLTSPDEGLLIGTERFLWSRDNQYLLLVGRHFFVKDGATTASGEQLYLLYHVPSGRIRCNARQADYEGFTLDDVLAIDFVQPLSK